MDEAAHRQLAFVLGAVQGKAAVSGYRCDLNDALYAGWTRFDAPVKTAHSVKQGRQECLWMNY
jgi:DNA adenine methylase